MKQFLFAFLVAGSLVACQSSSANPPHGQEGHKCDKECMASQESKTGAATSETADLKDHVCTDACKDGNHVYAHGEKGHTCTDACKNQSNN
ncbi:MAG: hypothetical protein HZB42_07985 [Sphingobacteriales bacterium]|nr:hypothetical protein [Sphingobacteriales bacterium]